MPSRVSIRPTTPEDVEFVFAIERDPEASPNITVRSRERHLASIESPDDEHLIVCEDGHRVGFFRLSGLAGGHRNIEIGTIVIAERGRGIGRASLLLVLERCFGEHGAHRVWLDAIGANERALALYESIGFLREGEMREAWRTGEDTYDSIVLLSMLDREWSARGADEFGGRPGS
jgi:diamine N-acetyltransferase